MTNLNSLFTHPFLVGFDRLVSQASEISNRDFRSFPSYNIKRESENVRVLELAVAGFTKEDLRIERLDSHLHIHGEKKTQESEDFIYHGISTRKFTRSFLLGDDIDVLSSNLKDGILTIKLEIRIPEEEKPKLIPID